MCLCCVFVEPFCIPFIFFRLIYMCCLGVVKKFDSIQLSCMINVLNFQGVSWLN